MGRDCYRVNGICVGFHYKFAGDYNADLKGIKIGSSVSDIEKTFGYNYLHFQNNYNYSLEDVDIFFYVDEYWEEFPISEFISMFLSGHALILTYSIIFVCGLYILS